MDPKAFRIIDGKLYLNWNSESAEQFEASSADNIKRADESWEKLTGKP